MFEYIVVNESKIIMCEYSEFKKRGLDNRRKALKIIKKAFPELFKGDLFGKKIKISIAGCYEGYSSKFDCQVEPQEKENDWGKNPFIALWLIEEGEKTYCDAKEVKI
ncbi:MAG: hypothetical protein ABIA02_00475 [Candidatus Falkowbacteria bacterium]